MIRFAITSNTKELKSSVHFFEKFIFNDSNVRHSQRAGDNYKVHVSIIHNVEWTRCRWNWVYRQLLSLSCHMSGLWFHLNDTEIVGSIAECVLSRDCNAAGWVMHIREMHITCWEFIYSIHVSVEFRREHTIVVKEKKFIVM